MITVYKILRKLKLNKIAYAVLSRFAAKEEVNMTAAEAEKILSEARPDPANSSLCETPLEDAKADGAEMDIIIPCYNVEKYVKSCISSVLDQKTHHSFHIIAVDDGSADKTGMILDEYFADSRVTVLHTKNAGCAGARNLGIRTSRAKYIYLLDSDDMLKPGAIDLLMDCAEDNSAYVVEGGYETIRENGRVRTVSYNKSGLIEDNEPSFGFPCGKLYRREIFSDIRFPEGYWYEDSIIHDIIFARFSYLGARVYGVAEPVFQYRINPTGITRSARVNDKCIDAIWIHRRMVADRQSLGIPKTQNYYEYMLRMVLLTYERTFNQPEIRKKAIFVLWRDLFGREFSEYRTENKENAMLEKAIADGDYGKYQLFCKLH